MSVEEFYNSIFVLYPNISTDSRNIIKDCLFFALKGESFDGNLYAKEAIKQGASYAIVDNESLCDDRIIFVQDVLKFLQDLAHYHRLKCNIPVIGITGTNGKTTTKELISAVLSKKYNVAYTKGNLNNHIGVPLTLLTMTKNVEIAVIEMGANHPGEIELLANIASPNFGIITNIGKAHLLGFGSFENVILTKTELYNFLVKNNGVIFQDADNKILIKNSKNATSVISYAFDNNVQYKGDLKIGSMFASFKFFTENASILIDSHLFGAYNAKNMLAAACIGSYFKIPIEDIKSAIENYIPSNNRSQFIKTEKNTLIMDAYNANPTSMIAALEHFAQVPADNKCVILGEMFELGTSSISEHQIILNLLQNLGISHAYLVGNWPIQDNNLFSYYKNSMEFLDYLKNNSLRNNLILVKGSRGVKLESLLVAL